MMTSSEATGTLIPYRRIGEGENVVLFIHGFLDAGAIWDPVIDRLMSPNIQKITLDLPGMGSLTDDAGTISLQRYADAVSSVLAELGKPAILVGQSMGAQVAELVAAAHSSQVAGLVLITPVPLAGVKAPAEMVAPFKQLGGELEAQRQIRDKLSHALSAADAEVLAQFGAKVTPRTVRALVEAWNEGHPAGLEPSAYTGPVLAISGSADLFVTDAMITGVVGRFANIQREVISDAGHWVHVEQAQAVAASLDHFIARASWPSLDASPGANDWKQAFAQRSASAFADAFAADVVLEATTLREPVAGRENVKQVMEAASKIYESLAFTDQATQGGRQYVEWRARAFGGVELSGVTVITRNEAGAIEHVAIHHRPMHGAMQFSVAIGERLTGVIAPSHFLAASSLPTLSRS